MGESYSKASSSKTAGHKRQSSSSAASQSKAKKHKHDGAKHSHADGADVTLKWSSQAAASSASIDEQRVEAVLVDSPSFVPPKTMSFFHRSHSDSDAPTPHLDDSLSVGSRPAQSPNVIIESHNWHLEQTDRTSPAELAHTRGYPGSYLVAVYDPATRQATLHPAPLLTLSRVITRAGGEAASARVQSNFATARRDLGEAFGNRKQKLAMRNADRMKVDTFGMDEGVLQGITESVQGKPKGQAVEDGSGNAGADSNPSASASSSAPADLASRPIPHPHLDAASPELVYPLTELFPFEVSSNINPSAVLHANDQDHIKRLLPGPTSRSNWLASRIWARVLASRRAHGTDVGGGDGSSSATPILKTSSSHQKHQTKLLLYIAYLWSVRYLSAQSKSRALNDRKSLKEKLRLVPRSTPGEDEDSASSSNNKSKSSAAGEALLDALLPRFCERERTTRKFHLTPFGETKLLSTIVVLCLHIDGFGLEVEVLSAEMGLSPNRLKEIAKSVGCTTRYRQNVGLAASGAGAGDDDGAGAAASTPGSKGKKVMVLKCPVKLPDGSKGGPPARR